MIVTGTVCRDERRPEILQKDQYHYEDEDARLVERMVDFVDGSLDEDRRVVRNVISEVLRETAGKVRHFRRDLLAHLQRIGIRRLINGDPRGRPAIEIA